MEGTRHGRYENYHNVSVWIVYTSCEPKGDGAELYVQGRSAPIANTRHVHGIKTGI